MSAPKRAVNLRHIIAHFYRRQTNAVLGTGDEPVGLKHVSPAKPHDAQPHSTMLLQSGSIGFVEDVPNGHAVCELGRLACMLAGDGGKGH
jgi:hypothetical protein